MSVENGMRSESINCICCQCIDEAWLLPTRVGESVDGSECNFAELLHVDALREWTVMVRVSGLW